MTETVVILFLLTATWVFSLLAVIFSLSCYEFRSKKGPP
jgi:hypothetical protein